MVSLYTFLFKTSFSYLYVHSLFSYLQQSCIFTQTFIVTVLPLKPKPYFNSSYLLYNSLHFTTKPFSPAVYLLLLFPSLSLRPHETNLIFLVLLITNIHLLDQFCCSCLHSYVCIYPLLYIPNPATSLISIHIFFLTFSHIFITRSQFLK